MRAISLYLEPITPEQAWELLQYDWELRLHLLSSELADEFRPKLNAIYEGKKRSESYYIRERIELELRQAEYTAKRYYDGCCEAWDALHRPRCRAFFLAVLHNVLIPSFDSRLSITSTNLQQRHPHEANLFSILSDFRRRLDKVRSRWATRIEIASRNNEYDQQHRELSGELADKKDELPPAKDTKRMARSKEACYESAAEIVLKKPDIDPLTFCNEMDRKAEQSRQSLKYLPPSSWNVRCFRAQLSKRKNTVSAFLSRIRAQLRSEGRL